jgi:hypothetical protein
MPPEHPTIRTSECNSSTIAAGASCTSEEKLKNRTTQNKRNLNPENDVVSNIHTYLSCKTVESDIHSKPTPERQQKSKKPYRVPKGPRVGGWIDIESLSILAAQAHNVGKTSKKT